MKPEVRDLPFTKKGWVFELKYDGFRLLAEKTEDGARLAYRSGRDATRIFPEIMRAVSDLPFQSLLLDGEAVILDEVGRPDFQRLQRRGQRTRSIDAERASIDNPAVLFVFDLLSFEGYDLRPLPLSVRKSVLRRVLPAGGLLRYVEEVPERGEDFYAAVSGMGLEGIVAKREDSPYRGGYSSHWLKIRVDRTSDFAVVGYEPGPGGFRCLHLAASEGSGLVYAGTVGSGFDNQEQTEIRARLEPARRPNPAADGAPKEKGVVWVEPELVIEVRYKEQTRGGHLRQPVFLRLREDKTVDECLRPSEAPEEEETPEPPREEKSGPRFTNLDKVFWPGEGYTKGDLIGYYRAVSPWILTYLRDRPLVLDRYPNGITGKSFFQKNAGDGGEYFLCNSEDDLLYLANLGAIPLHVWSSRVESIDRPDWCILDLDPKGAPFRDVVRIALAIGDLCDEIELPALVKTSGGSGLHILIPMGAQFDHDAVRQVAELLARVVVDRLPAIATTLRSIPARKGRVYVDALQNGRGKLLAAPYSVRPHPGAPVSTPLRWSEVSAKLDVRKLNLKTVPKRLEKLGEDPLRPVLELRPDLMSALGKLSELI
ncbi:MAG TPA: DNA ligase D [Thermoanaerobaculia bacterium]|nr:DNA ligase D [Thermoanaerobaculia bacterium]